MSLFEGNGGIEGRTKRGEGEKDEEGGRRKEQVTPTRVFRLNKRERKPRKRERGEESKIRVRKRSGEKEKRGREEPGGIYLL